MQVGLSLIAVPGTAVAVNVGVGAGRGVSVGNKASVDEIAVSVATPPVPPAAACGSTGVTTAIVAVAIGRGAKLPQAMVGASQISETANNTRNCQELLIVLIRDRVNRLLYIAAR